MNNRQKEILQAQLNNEKRVLKELKQVYQQAIKDCSASITQLSTRTDMENIQTIVYQQQYQQAIKAQLEIVLTQLQAGEFATISDYLAKSYQNGYIGTMYDIAGQGIPLIVPIDQRAIVQAIQIDSKISKGLYNRLGEDVKALKTSIRAEVSRGIANGSSWNEIGQKISLGMNSTIDLFGFNKAQNNSIRIARTEGHRIQNTSALDAQEAAKKKGADILKQWDSALDGNTRPAHAQADGQIREIDEFFDVGGEKMKAPGVGGSAANVVNCRCALLQRARWALDEEELNTLKERAEYFGLDKAKDFEEYKAKYLKASEQESVNVQKSSKGTSQEKALEKVNVQKITFVPAQSIEEAEEYAKKHFVKEKTWSGDGNVSFKGISVESANKINETLTKLYSENDIPLLNNIQPMNFRSNIWKGCESAPMAYRNMGSGELYYNAKILKNSKTVDSYIAEGKNAFEICKNNLDKFTGSKKEIVERYIQSGRSLVAEDCDNIVKALTEHEMGHHIENQIIMRNKDMAKVVADGFDKYGVKISGYASKTYGEYIAESYSAYRNGQSDIIDPELMKVFKSIEKTEIKAKGSTISSKTLENSGKISKIESDIVKEAIDSGKVKTEININKQNRHIKDSKDYVEGRSYINGTIEDAQNLVDKLSGTGEPVYKPNGEWNNKEKVEASDVIGVDINPDTKVETKTNKATIHYSKTGTHIIPRKGD